jgi:hypothetical protein
VAAWPSPWLLSVAPEGPGVCLGAVSSVLPPGLGGRDASGAHQELDTEASVEAVVWGQRGGAA